MMIIMRGISGSGKSFLARKLQSLFENSVIHSTDNYFMVDGVYKFNPAKLGHYHKCNQEDVISTLECDCIPIVDNTNTTWAEVKTYLEIAKKFGSEVIVVEPLNAWSNDVNECATRNTHTVPIEAISRMASRFTPMDEIIKRAKESLGMNVLYVKMSVAN